ncbi:MAG: ABC transporter substrate-binding protein [Halieaceae bacterium]|jgi:phospholipid transport system substrate-binding protein|nr:ABC transporter substrate-binding protein [Halieaceae bacterium]
MSEYRRVGWIFGLWLLVAVAWGQAEISADQTAHDVVSDATTRVMSVVSGVEEDDSEDLHEYYREIHEILDPVIDYRGFARSVMGPYASRDYYQSLDEAGRAQLREYLNRFADVMRVGLVRTYGKGLLAFGSSRIEVDTPSEEEVGESRISVRQLIYSEEPEPYVILYQMGRNKAGEWKLRNVIIETVNLGEIYKNQFQAAARKHNGDLNEVISQWAGANQDSAI